MEVLSPVDGEGDAVPRSLVPRSQNGAPANPVVDQLWFDADEEVVPLEPEPGAPGDPGPPGDPGADGVDGVDGENGASAYEIAVTHGFEGTEQEWLDSLHSGAETFSQTILSSGSGTVNITHDLGTEDVYVSVRRIAGGTGGYPLGNVYVHWVPTSVNVVQVDFDGYARVAGEFRVTVKK